MNNQPISTENQIRPYENLSRTRYGQERDRRIIQLKAQGLQAAEIGSELYLSHRTIENHLCRIQRTMGARNSEQMIYLAMKQGLIQ